MLRTYATAVQIQGQITLEGEGNLEHLSALKIHTSHLTFF
jgi:hypothetical protein